MQVNTQLSANQNEQSRITLNSLELLLKLKQKSKLPATTTAAPNPRGEAGGDEQRPPAFSSPCKHPCKLLLNARTIDLQSCSEQNNEGQPLPATMWTNKRQRLLRSSHCARENLALRAIP